jgi:hypothetical protein
MHLHRTRFVFLVTHSAHFHSLLQPPKYCSVRRSPHARSVVPSASAQVAYLQMCRTALSLHIGNMADLQRLSNSEFWLAYTYRKVDSFGTERDENRPVRVVVLCAGTMWMS